MSYFTPDQYVLKCLLEHPSLYSIETFDEVKYKVLDHTLNTIGNAIDCIDEFLYKDVDFEKAEKYITQEALYYVNAKANSRKTELPNGRIFYIPNSYEETIVCLESEKSSYDENLYYFCKNTRHEEIPYPNFTEKYSTVYEFDFSELGKEWIEAAIWYYKKSLEWFESSKSSNYHYAFPNTHKVSPLQRDPTEVYLEDFKERIKKYSSDEEISKAYELEYKGDPYEFLCRRWDLELERIKTFCKDTIKMLEGKL